MNEYYYEALFKIVMIGESGCGKSSILTQYTKNFFDEFRTLTIGVELGTKIIKIKNKKIKLQIWDTAGQEVFRSITVNYYRGIAGALLVFDVTNINSFDKLDSWINELRRLGHEHIEIIIIGNKTDLKERKIKYNDAIRFAKKYNIEYIECSSKYYKLCEYVFFRLAQKIKIKYDLLNNLTKNINTINTPLLLNNYNYKNKSCCN